MKHYQPNTKNRERRGAVVIVVLVALAIVMALVVTWARTAVLERRQLRTLADQAQAVWLAESGVERAAWKLSKDPAYAGETWQVSPEELGGRQGGAVTIRIEKPDDANAAGAAQSRRVVVTADFPADSDRRARHTKQLNLSPGKTGENP